MLIYAVTLISMVQAENERVKMSDTNRNVPAEGVLNSGYIPKMDAFTAEGKPITVNELCEGKYTVLTAGCLTCPLFHQNYPEIESAYADYADKGVQFFYFYKQLRHPELDGYVQAQNMSERLLQLDIARTKLGTKVPWIADTMEDDIRIGLRSGSYSVFLISPDGKVVYGADRIDARGLRNALSREVGMAKQHTLASDLSLPTISRPVKLENENTPLSVKRPEGLTILKITPTEPQETYYVKLRAEADDALLETGTGRLFLGFYPDPIHEAHWNNLAPPMQYELSLPSGLVANPKTARALVGQGDSDSKPRQFWVDVSGEHSFEDIVLTLNYYACNADMCRALSQEYTISLEPENRGSRTYGMNKGKRGASKQSANSSQRMQRLDLDKDGRVSFDEMYMQMKSKQGEDFSREKARQQFNRMDTNDNGYLSVEEVSNAPQKGKRK